MTVHQWLNIGPATLLQGDCLDVLKELDDNSVDAIVTDPPYGIRFMGAAWDGTDIENRVGERRAAKSHAPNAGPNGGHKSIAAEAGKYDLSVSAMRAFQEWTQEWAREALRVLKPGGYLLSFASPRTYHRMATGIEDAGFEVEDQLMWIFGSGFPKNYDFAKDFEASKEAGFRIIKPEFIGHAMSEGFGSALKPAHEPICMGRKPLIGTIAANVLTHGTGAINIDECRVPITDADDGREFEYNHNGCNRSTVPEGGKLGMFDGGWKVRKGNVLVPEGRWPANVLHDGSDEVVALFPDAKGQQGRVTGDEPTASGFSGAVKFGGMLGRQTSSEPRIESNKSAARFFYCPKASKRDRDEGCDDLEARIGGLRSNTSGQHITRRDEGYEPTPSKNHHPTVKPTELMRYLCRLVTPPGGTVLDPFMGSGSTGKAAVLEGFGFIGIDKDADGAGDSLGYMAVAAARISFAVASVEASQALKEARRNNDVQLPLPLGEVAA